MALEHLNDPEKVRKSHFPKGDPPGGPKLGPNDPTEPTHPPGDPDPPPDPPPPGSGGGD